MRQLSKSTDLDTIAAYISSPAGSIELPEHLERRSNAYALIASILLDYPFKRQDEIEAMVISVYPELTKGTLYSYIRDTKYIYGQLDKIDRGFERATIKMAIGKGIKECYATGELRPLPKLIELWIKLYRLDRPDALTESTDDLKQQVTNIYMIQKNELNLGDDKIVDLDKYMIKLESQLRDEKKNEE